MVAVAHAVDQSNPVAQGHSNRVAAIADAIGRRSSLPSDQMDDLRTAAFLHDVAHMTIEETGGENFAATGHAQDGEKIVTGARFPAAVVSAVLHHHDRWDGAGQPEGIGGLSIPHLARILAAVERFEALTAGRGGPRLAPQDALARVAERSGTEIDPAVVEALDRAVHDGGLDLNLSELALAATAAA